MNSLLPEINKLKNIQKYLEAQENSAISYNKFGADTHFEEFVSKLDHDRNGNENKTIGDLKSIMQTLKEKKHILKTEDVLNLDLKNFKQSMVHIQDEMHNLKAHLKLNLADLKFAEKEISDDIEVFNKKILEWEKPITTSLINYKCQSTILKNNTCNNNKEIKDFIDFVHKSNGHENGWSQDDHNLFLKLRSKYKNIDNFAGHLHKLLPDISVEDIKTHESWYRQYLYLKNKQKDALKKWKEDKNKRDQTLQPEHEEKPQRKILTKTNDDLREKIASWKLEREEKKLQLQASEQSKRLQQQKMTEEKWKLHEEVKLSIEKWKQAKQCREMKEKLLKKKTEEQEKKLRSMEANKLIKQFQSQDDLYLVKIKTRKQPKQEVKRSKSSYSAQRDPKRLLQPTRQWISRTSRNNSSSQAQNSRLIPVFSIPKLHIPEWKKNTAL